MLRLFLPSMVALQILWWLLLGAAMGRSQHTAAHVCACLMAGGIMLAVRVRSLPLRGILGAAAATGLLQVLTVRSGWDELQLQELVRYLHEHGLADFCRNYFELPYVGNKHPPLYPLFLYACSWLLGDSIVGLRCAMLAVYLLTVWVVFRVARLLFEDETARLAAAAFVGLRISLEIGCTLCLDPMLVLFTSLGVWAALQARQGGPGWSVLAFFALAAGLYTKYTMVFYFPLAVLLVWQAPAVRRRLLVLAYTLAVLLWLPFVLPNLGKQPEGVWRHASIRVDAQGLHASSRWSLGRRLRRYPQMVSGFGLYFVPSILAGFWLAARRRDEADLLALAWFGSVVLPVAVLQPLSRYLLPAYPAAALVLARTLKRQPSVHQMMVLAMLYSADCGLMHAAWEIWRPASPLD